MTKKIDPTRNIVRRSEAVLDLIPTTPEAVEQFEKENLPGLEELPEELRDPQKVFLRGRALERASQIVRLFDLTIDHREVHRKIADKLQEWCDDER